MSQNSITSTPSTEDFPFITESAKLENEGRSDALHRDLQSTFAWLGILLMFLLCLLPAWNAVELLQSPSYVFFSHKGFPFNICLLVAIIVYLSWGCMQDAFSGLSFKCLTSLVPRSLPFEGCTKRFQCIPTEVWIMTGLAVFLLLVWDAVPFVHLIWGVDIVSPFAPIWNILTFFGIRTWLSTDPAASILASCVATLVLFALSPNNIFARPRPDRRKGAPSILKTWACFSMMLGIALMVFSTLIKSAAGTARAEILLTCEQGSRTGLLFNVSQELQAIRQAPGCIIMNSVENCMDFKPTKYSTVLKSMELDLACAGFCYYTGSSATHDSSYHQDYPPTLFSQGNYKLSCDGMAARNLGNFVGTVAAQIFQQGFLLLLLAVASWLLLALGTFDDLDREFQVAT